MFSSLSREDFSWSRSVKALPVFFLLWLGGAILATMILLVIRSHLHTIERIETEKLLTSYLTINHSPDMSSTPHHVRNGSALQGLIFVRMIHGNDHIIVINEHTEHPTFRGLVDLPAEKHGVWLVVGSGREEMVLTIIIKTFDDVLIQTAKDGSEWYEIYKKIVRQTVLVVVGSSLVLWPLALYYVRLSLSSLIYTRKKIDELVRLPTSELLPENGNGPELDSLHRHINYLIRQNHHLVAEMQDSLDNVAHDLRTPMTRLRSVAEYGLQAEDDTKRLREALSDCLEESERVLAMLGTMMSVAEAESGTMRLELQKCQISKTLAEVVTLYEYVAEEKEVRVQLKVEEEVYAMLDCTRISQVWANLLDNAIKYTNSGGWVQISVAVDGHYGLISFEDNGMGISESEQGRIWERLYRGDRSRSQKGLGLGLNYVRAVVEAHGATVSVSSVLHQGSRFEIRFKLSGP